jgi:hypothetical protein
MEFLNKQHINYSQYDYIFTTKQQEFSITYTWSVYSAFYAEIRESKTTNHKVTKIKISVNPHSNEIIGISLLTDKNIDLIIKELNIGESAKQKLYNTIQENFKKFQESYKEV